ncbi:MAG: hypothetical protein CVV02_06530 [Firmicutes bacterium HGW-Firmicutes-7]|nr:MAG: hypothetical protein CVV02_06530 [Firmicutes bacterium HGW-Firmicutes-7]
MKRIWLVLALVLLLTGCSSDDLSNYKKALEETNSIEKGKIQVNVRTKIDFVSEGLTDTQIRDLSYFDQIEFDMSAQYDASSESNKVIVKSYYNFGGMGFDSKFYIDGSNMYMKMPIINGYISFNPEDLDQEKSNRISEDVCQEIIKPVLEKWNELLKQEDVLKGKKTYVLTEEGQIKTTTYSIDASEEQLKAVGDEMISVIKDQDIIETFLREGFKEQEVDQEDVEEILSTIEGYISRLVLEGFKGIAYVDFDGRLIKEEYEINLGWISPKKGEPRSVEILFSTVHSNLGEEQVFEFPTVKEDQWINMNDFDQKSIFPENIF